MSSKIAANLSSGIERQLLVDVSELCQRDSATGVQRVVRSYLQQLLAAPPKDFVVRPVYASLENGYRYANKFTHELLRNDCPIQQDSLITFQRGDVFFGLDMQHHVQLRHQEMFFAMQAAGVTVKFMVYDLLPIQFPNLFADSKANELHKELMRLIVNLDEAICISKATAEALMRWVKSEKVSSAKNFKVSWLHMGSDFLKTGPSTEDPGVIQECLKKIAQRPSFLWVSTIEPRKGQDLLLDAFEELWKAGHEFNLLFVGQQGWKVDELAQRINNHAESNKRLFWLQGISDEFLEKVYACCTCLIAASLNEGFGLPLIEAARHKLPILARDIPVFREVAGQGAYFFQADRPEELTVHILNWMDLYKKGKHPQSSQIRWSTWKKSSEKLKTILTLKNYSPRQLFLDISELIQRDAGSGIQRVVWNILRELIKKPPRGFRVEPVYAEIDRDYLYARSFCKKMGQGFPENVLDEPIEFAPGDIFFGLDMQPQVQRAKAEFYQHLRRVGVKTAFLVHDLLPLKLPWAFPVGTQGGFEEWLSVVAQADQVICVSQSVAKDLHDWIRKKSKETFKDYPKIDWSHNGVSFQKKTIKFHTPQDQTSDGLCNFTCPTFLMVGTIEPRKGHAQILEAFELLWHEGVQISLLIIGKQGWMVEDLVEKIKTHPLICKQLFWLPRVSDEELQTAYRQSTCLIAGSFGEGFGLPLIEAAHYQLPILARDIDVFREVAGPYAEFSTGSTSEEWAAVIKKWLQKYQKNKYIKSTNLKYLSWSDSVKNLKEILEKKNTLNEKQENNRDSGFKNKMVSSD